MVNVLEKCSEILNYFAEGLPILWDSLINTTLRSLLDIPEYVITAEWITAILDFPVIALICGAGVVWVVSISLVRWVLGVGK